MEQSSQNPPTTEEALRQPLNEDPIKNTPNSAPEASQPNFCPLPPKPKKRKPNANGPRKTSIAWDHFTKLPESEAPEPTAACNYCRHTYRCDPKIHGTSSMLHHLTYCSKYLGHLANDPTQTVLTFAPSGSGTNPNLVSASHRFNVEACRKALATFVIIDEQPFKVVEGEGFKHLCRQLQPHFTIPSRYTIGRDCFQLYLDEKIRLKAFFKSNCSRVALTSDCWTSIQNLNYLTLTAHFIDNEWKYQKRIISFSTVLNHKGETIGRQIEETLREWGLRSLCTVTLDNATSNDTAAAYLKKRFTNISGGLVLDGEFFHMRCCAHILNLVVNDGLKDSIDSISSIRNAVRFVRSSPQRQAKFRECCEFVKISSKKLVCLDVPIRWNSTFIMLDTAIPYQDAFKQLEFEELGFVDYFGAAGPPTAEHWDNAKAFVKFLKIFYEATNVFSASLHVTIHTTFHQLATIFSEIRKCCMDKNPTFMKMGWEMKKKI